MSLLKSLGYVTVSTADIDRWREFAFGVLGFAEGSGPDPSALYLRMDERAARIIVVPGDGDRIVTVGWEVRDHAALVALKAVLDVENYRYATSELSQTTLRSVLGKADLDELLAERELLGGAGGREHPRAAMLGDLDGGRTRPAGRRAMRAAGQSVPPAPPAETVASVGP